MERGQTTGNGSARPNGAELGVVARDVIDHASIIVRDSIKIGEIRGRRYLEHLRHDVVERVAWGAAAAVVGTIAVLSGLVALFLGIASAIGSVAWTFAIFAAGFAVLAVVSAALAARQPKRDEAEEIARRFPATRTQESRPEHLLAEQQRSAEGHRREIEEARREAEAGRPARLSGPGGQAHA